MILDVIASLGGLVIPPAFDFLKKKFLKSNSDTPDSTLNSLAVTNPEVMPKYIESLSSLFEAKTKFYNRDVIGEASKWVVNLRAVIRPVFVIVSVVVVFAAPFSGIEIPEDVRVFVEMNVASWFGSRLY